jgi:hypothetical protein
VDTWDPTTWWFGHAGALGGKVYTGSGGSAWVHDGTTWSKGPDMAGLGKPLDFAGVLVFEALGTLWTYDGVRTRYAGVEVFHPPYPYGGGLYELAEGRLVVVTAELRVESTTDLETWTCHGEAPADVASIGVLGGVIFFGGAEAQVYGYEEPSW